MKCSIILFLAVKSLAIASYLQHRSSVDLGQNEVAFDFMQLHARSPGRRKNPQGKSRNQQTKLQATQAQTNRPSVSHQAQTGSGSIADEKPPRQNAGNTKVARTSPSITPKSAVVPNEQSHVKEPVSLEIGTAMKSLTISEPVRENRGGAIAGPNSRSPSPPSSGRSSRSSSRTSSPGRPSTPTDPEYKAWLGLNTDAIEHSTKMTVPTKSSTDEKLIDIATLKNKAKLARAKEKALYAETMRITSGHRALSPTTKKAMIGYLNSAEKAVSAGSDSTMAQNRAIMHYTDTDKQDLLPDMIRSSARELTRTKARASHRAAVQSGHLAKSTKEYAEIKPAGDAERGPSYGAAAMARKAFLEDAAQYHQDQHEYKYTKWKMAGGDSSTDEDRSLEDAPRTKTRKSR